MANSDSRGGRGLKQAIAVLSPAIRVKVCERGRGCATALRRCHPRQSGMTAKQRIVVRGKLSGQSLPCDRAVEHPADPDTIEIGCSDSEADDLAGEYIHHYHDPIALEQN